MIEKKRNMEGKSFLYDIDNLAQRPYTAEEQHILDNAKRDS
jgi:hypothetical protein